VQAPLAESQRVVHTELQSSEGILVSGEVVNSHASSLADLSKAKVAAPVVQGTVPDKEAPAPQEAEDEAKEKPEAADAFQK